jgi:thioredoxin reductase (NADPH)
MAKIENDVIIIGSGSAGYTAAIYLARANLKPVIIAGNESGGQLMITTDVENYPGFAEIQGPDLMENMKNHALKFGTEIISDHITEFTVKKDENGKNRFIMKGQFGDEYEAKAVIIATGATAKWLHDTDKRLVNEQKFLGYGVSGCATCDAFFFKNKTVAVVGGGNTAAEDALFLTHHVKKVYLVHRRDEMRAEKILQDRMRANPKIEFMFNKVVDDIIGVDSPKKKVTHLRLKSSKILDLDLSDKTTDIEVDGIFIAIGHKPNSDLFTDLLDIDDEGYINTEGKSTKTNVDGLFACGDVQDKIYRQAITAAGSGCMAALDVEKYLA